MRTVWSSARSFHHILGGLSCVPQSSGIYSGQYDQLPHKTNIPGLWYQLLWIFPMVISIDMVYNILVVGFSFQLIIPQKKTAVSFFKMAVFFYSASVCRLLIITIFLPSPQYLFSVFCRRKSGHLPELPWEEFFIIVTAAYCCRINAHGGRIQ